MCNTMASMTIIFLISIASIAAITVEAVNTDSADKDWDNTHVDKLSGKKFGHNFHIPTAPKHHVFYESSELDSRPRVHPLKKLPKLTKTELIESQDHAGQRNRRQIVVSMANWKLQHLRTKENKQNRRRRSASGAETSSDKITTASTDPAVSNDGHKMSAFKCLLSIAFPVSLPTQCIQFSFRSLFKAIH